MFREKRLEMSQQHKVVVAATLTLELMLNLSPEMLMGGPLGDEGSFAAGSSSLLGCCRVARHTAAAPGGNSSLHRKTSS